MGREGAEDDDGLRAGPAAAAGAQVHRLGLLAMEMLRPT